MALARADLVTVPHLDARFAAFETKIIAAMADLKVEVRTDIANVKADLMRWVLLVMLGNVALTAGATAIVNYLQHKS